MPRSAEQAQFPVLPEPANYLPYADAREQPNIIVDAAPLKSTVLTLSHWPVNTTPEPLKRDTSTETAFAYLDSPSWHQSVPFVSNNHFDEDGLCSMFALCEPAIAQAHRQLLINTAEIGDFGTSRDTAALQLFLLIEAFADATVSPLPASVFRLCDRQRTVELYTHMLGHLPIMLANLNVWSSLWQPGEQFVNESEELCARGDVTIEEDLSLDLAIVHLPAELPLRTFNRYIGREQAALHPFAVQRRTECSRMLWVQGANYVFNYRYESWVQLVSRRPALRMEMASLVGRLNGIETADGIWTCDPIDVVSPRLFLDGAQKSTISQNRFIGELKSHLRSASIAWDPYNWAESD